MAYANKLGGLDIPHQQRRRRCGCADSVTLSDEEISRAIDLNLKSVIYGSRDFAQVMMEQRQGTIVNISSVCAKQAWPQWTLYASAKWGVFRHLKGLYVELQPVLISVSAVRSPPLAARILTGTQNSAGGRAQASPAGFSPRQWWKPVSCPSTLSWKKSRFGGSIRWSIRYKGRVKIGSDGYSQLSEQGRPDLGRRMDCLKSGGCRVTLVEDRSWFWRDLHLWRRQLLGARRGREWRSF